MGDYEDITLVGNLGREPEMRYLPNGTAVTNFSMAVNRKKKGDQEITHWFRITAWGDLAESCNEYLHSGSKVMVAGSLIADEKTGGPVIFERNDGSTGASFEVNARLCIFLDKLPPGEKPQESRKGSQSSKSKVPPSDDDEIPF